MHKSARKILLIGLSASLFACTSTSVQHEQKTDVSPKIVHSTIKPTMQQTPGHLVNGLSLEMIMADPDWMGQQPQNPYWAVNGEQILYQRKRVGSQLRDLWSVSLDATDNGEKVTLSSLHLKSVANRITSADKRVSAWVFKGNIFVSDSGNIKQLTRATLAPHNLRFLLDGRLSFQSGDSFHAIDVQSGLSEQLVSWKFAEAPVGNKAPKDYIAEQQLALIDFAEIKRKNRQEKFDYDKQLLAENSSLVAKAFYLPVKHRTVEASLSPNGRWMIISEREDKTSRTEEDIMPNYIGEDGRIKAEKVRARVAETEPQNQTIWLIDIVTHKQKKLSYQSLPGFNDDVLEKVKRENAEAKGEQYQTNRLPREIGLQVDWYWKQSPIQWNTKGDQVALMLEAWDNKDRWIANVNFESSSLVSQHRLHDDAWINYKFNSFGWLNNSNTLYYLSEQSGYAHLYQKPLDGKEIALTSGQYEVDELTLSDDDQYMYFQANKKHPGIYEVYRVGLSTGEIETLTDLNGYSNYSLSPDQSKLLLTHSKLTLPPELYVQSVNDKTSVKRITHTVSDAFTNVNWVAPEIVPVKSSNTTAPVYSRVYFPENYQQGEKRKAVIFSHGAGYLQNSHLGWSGYFREFMFHSFLVQQGYVVMDMDYRASAGYGRDWRTAIYRHMGKAEVEDLQDGVNWLTQNANVDAQRVGTYGGSYGGFMTFMALFTEPDLFQAGAALRPVSDWAHYNHGYTSNILNLPDIDPIAYERSSPIYFAEGLTKPLLINAPMVDSNVFFVDVVRLVQRLIELEKQNFETAIYPVESHGFVQPSSWLDEYRRIYKLFETNL